MTTHTVKLKHLLTGIFLISCPLLLAGQDARQTAKGPVRIEGARIPAADGEAVIAGPRARGGQVTLKDVHVEVVPVMVASSGRYRLQGLIAQASGEEAGRATSPSPATGPSPPLVFTLLQNFPNPFNPSTTISFEIPGAPGTEQRVGLRIYDVRGRLVRTLIDTGMEPGRHQVAWEGKDETGRSVSSGIYLYTLKVEGMSLTRKMAVTR